MKTKVYILQAMLVCGLTAGQAHANTVVGAISCAQWQDRKNKPADAEAYAVWLNGYLSGANGMYGEMLARDFIRNSDKISIQDWTDVYCDKHPKAMLQDSADALVKLLIRDLPF